MLLFHNGFEIVKMFFELVPKQICCRSNTFSVNTARNLRTDLTLQSEQETCRAYWSDTNTYSCRGHEVWAAKKEKEETGISEWKQEELIISRMK